MRREIRAVFLFFLIALVVLVAQSPRPERARPVRLAARGTRGAVAAGADYATDAGMRILQRGGNAVDAGVAAMFAAAVTEYSHFGFGGEAPILIRTRDGLVRSISGVGTMPAKATAHFFRSRDLQPHEVYEKEPNGLRHMVPTAGILAALVPGMPDAALVALREFGTMRVEDVLLPAVELADGTAIDEPRVRSILSTQKILEIYPSSSRVFLPEGAPPRAGEIFRQPDLARTLRSLIEAEKRSLAAGAPRGQAIDAVRDAFYRGEIAKRIGAFSESNGGLLRADDFAAFRAKVEDAACTEFRGYTVCKPGFWTQGPAMLETLNILDGVDLGPLGLNSTAYIHQVVEALKLGYADRDAYYGDPDFVKVPGEALLSKAYGEKRRALIGENASLEFRPGEVEGVMGMHPAVSQMARADISDALMAKDTTCVTAIDKEGVMFSATPSGAWLPSVIAGDTGIPLTQRAQSFLLLPGHPNELAPKKRPRVTLSPTLVTRDGKPVLVMATPGGDNQDQSLLQVMLNILVFGSNAQSSVEAPRFQTRHLVSSFDNHGMMPGDLGLDERIPANVVNELNARGHKTNVRSRYNSGAAPVVIRVLPNGVLEAGADPYGNRSARAW